MAYMITMEKEDGSYCPLFGNNEHPDIFIEELKRQGCEVDENGNFDRFEIEDVQSLIEALNRYIIWQWEYHFRSKSKNMFDLSKSLSVGEKVPPLYYSIESLIENSPMFVVHNFLKFFKDELCGDNPYEYKIKYGCRIFINLIK